MCGIVGYIGKKEATPVLLEGLKRLEYRGYDSAGLAILNGTHLKIVRALGKLSNLSLKVKSEQLTGYLGIGHTRWATHGKPSEINAHPHRSQRVILVHNGIIENYKELKESLPKKGKELLSETDTEIICHVMDGFLQKKISFFDAFKKTLTKLEGAYSLVVLDPLDPSRFYIAKKGSPLVVGLGKNETLVASDIPALLAHTRKVIFLEDGDIGICSSEGLSLFDLAGRSVQRAVKEISWTPEMAEKGGFKHFMLKEIMEQPRAIEDTLLGRLSKGKEELNLPELEKLFPKSKKKFPSFNRFYMVACGTSYHAAMAGKYFVEAIAKVPVNVDTASEFRYREPFIDRKTVLLVISQSGETADTLACVQMAREQGAKVIAICNAVDSSIARLAHANLYTQAGPEIGVASTKAFTTQLTLLLMLALDFARRSHQIDSEYLKKAVRALAKLPKFIQKILDQKDQMFAWAKKFYQVQDVYYIARGVHFPIALEGALKLKEISYVHAEGYSAGEMKHGPIALIEPGTPVIALAPQDRVCEKMLSNIEEMRARGAELLVFSTEKDSRFDAFNPFCIPKTLWYLSPILISIPLQLFSYYMADLKGTDVDQPRNLAKSVTVE